MWFDKSLVTQDTTRIGGLHHDVPGVCVCVSLCVCLSLCLSVCESVCVCV